MAIEATELFRHFSSLHAEVLRLPAQARVQVIGTVVGVWLRHDKFAVVALAGDDRGVETVECRCVSDDVLLRVTVGAHATLEGTHVGLEDSVTLVLELCELLDVENPPHRWREAPAAKRTRPAPVPSTTTGAAELFDRYAARGGRGRNEPEEEVEVTGKVTRCFLRPDGTACALLAAGCRGACSVECRFLSDEVLLRLVVGATATVRGACQGFEDSLTLVVERCELLPAQVEPRPERPAVRAPEAFPVPVTAAELFERCARPGRTDACTSRRGWFAVTGSVEKTFVRQGVACVSLRADEESPRTVECRCASDEVLSAATPGAVVTLRGFAAGMDDVLTLVLERCELFYGARTRPRSLPKRGAKVRL